MATYTVSMAGRKQPQPTLAGAISPGIYVVVNNSGVAPNRADLSPGEIVVVTYGGLNGPNLNAHMMSKLSNLARCWSMKMFGDTLLVQPISESVLIEPHAK